MQTKQPIDTDKIEYCADGEERFRAAVNTAANAGPIHRQRKPKAESKPAKAPSAWTRLRGRGNLGGATKILILVGALTIFTIPALAQNMPIPWTLSVDLMNWTPIGLSGDHSSYFMYKILKADSTKTTYPKLWIRVENVSETQGQNYQKFLGIVELDEIDCIKRRLHTIQSTIYSGRNLSGDTHDQTGPFTWTYASPGSFGDKTVDLACEPSAADVMRDFEASQRRKKSRAVNHVQK